MTNQKETMYQFGPYRFDEKLLTLMAHVAMKTVFSKVIPEICQQFGAAIEQAIEDCLKDAQGQDATTIGESGAEHISLTLKDVARKIAPESKQRQQSIRSGVEMDLRTTLDHHGTGKAWKTLPLAKWEQAKAELKKLVAKAEIMSRANPTSGCQGEGQPALPANKKEGGKQ